MYLSCSMMQSTYPSLIHPTAIIFSGAHLHVTLGARLFMEIVNSSLCAPVERYCDRVADCPHGSDEAGCSCEDLDKYECSIGRTTLCVYKQWINKLSMDSPCKEIYEEVFNVAGGSVKTMFVSVMIRFVMAETGTVMEVMRIQNSVKIGNAINMNGSVQTICVFLIQMLVMVTFKV